jgi:Flp pilus assembly protein TadD
MATRMIRMAAATDPLNSSFLDSLGWAYYKAGDFSLARKYLERSVRLLDGGSALVYDHLGDADHRIGDADAARRHWRKALELIQEDRDPPPGRAELTASVRAKLQALEAGVAPQTAPLAESR